MRVSGSASPSLSFLVFSQTRESMRRVDGIPDPMHMSELREMVMGREADALLSVGSQSRTQLSN